MQPEFKEYAKQVVSNAKAFADEFIKLGYKVISNDTQNHMFVLDIYNSTNKEMTGRDLETELDKINITVNKNQIPNDELPPLKSSGVRIGTPAMTTKGFKEADFIKLANLIHNFINEYISFGTDTNYGFYQEEVKSLIEKVL